MSEPKPSFSHEIRLSPLRQEVHPALEHLGLFCQNLGVVQAEWDQIRLSVDEALHNAIEHGCSKHPRGVVFFRWGWNSPYLSIEISDPGDYSPEELEVRLPQNPLRERGRGRFLISKLMDRMDHHQEKRRHVLRMFKKIHQTSV